MIEFYQPDVDSINYMDAGEPSVSEEVIGAPNTETWLQSMKFEMDLIHQNQMWELIKITSRKAITLQMGLLIQICIWLKEAQIQLAKGFKQEHGDEYEKIFSSVVKMTTGSWWLKT